MYQLRFLIGSPRRNAPHIFNHRDYRGQRTQPDPLHPDYMTYVCAPTEHMSSHQVMTTLLEHANQHQRGNNLITLVELYNPQTGERAHLKGDEVVLRKSDIEAAKEAVSKAAESNPIFKAMDYKLHEAYRTAAPGDKIVFSTQGKHAALKDILECLKKEFPEASIGATTIDGDTQHTDIFKPKDIFNPKPPVQPDAPKGEDAPQPPKEQTLLDRIKAAIAENPKTATMLSNELGVSADAIKDAVAAEGSGLINKGGWIKPLATE